jgi:hypothetical protein
MRPCRREVTAESRIWLAIQSTTIAESGDWRRARLVAERRRRHSQRAGRRRHGDIELMPRQIDRDSKNRLCGREEPAHGAIVRAVPVAVRWLFRRSRAGRAALVRNVYAVVCGRRAPIFHLTASGVTSAGRSVIELLPFVAGVSVPHAAWMRMPKPRQEM